MEMSETALYRLIGERVKARRLALEMSQSQLADAIGMLRTSISNIEAGRQKTPIHVLYKICGVLGVEATELLPNLEEINQLLTVPQVPPKTAEVIKRIQTERPGS
jgi:transcriptional regulator with XRE-family HTH domain